MKARLIVTRTTVAALLAMTTSCGSDRSSTVTSSIVSTSTSPTPTSPAGTQPTETSPSATTAAANTTAGGPVDDTASITAAFTTFFDGADPSVDHKVAVLEGGEKLRSMLDDAAANPQFQQLSTTVTSVKTLDDAACAAAGEQPPCALVTHDLFVGGLPAMVNLSSHAVRDGTTWKVSRASWCAIVKIGGETCPGS